MLSGRQLRLLANVMTVSRYAVTGAIVATGVSRADFSPYERLCLILGLNILGWTTDMIDGWAARKSGQPSAAWGAVDLVADYMLQWGTAYALAAARFVPLDWIKLYLLVVALALAAKPAKNVSQVASLPLVILPVGVCAKYYPQLLSLYLGWAACAAILFWGRLCNQAVEFIDHLPGRPRRWFSGTRDRIVKHH